MRLSRASLIFSALIISLFSLSFIAAVPAFGEMGDRVNSTTSSKPERLDREPTAQEIEKSVAKYKTYYVSYFPGRATKDDKDTVAKKQSEGDTEKNKGIKRRFTSAYDPHRKEAILVPQLVGDGEEIGKGKKDNEAVTKLELTEISTLCIPGCDPEKDPEEQAVCVIIDTKEGKRYDFKCGKDKKNFKKNGYVGTVQLAIDVATGKAADYMDYKVTEVIAYEGKVEKQNLALSYDPEVIDPVTGKKGKYVKYPHSAHYIGSTSPKDQNPNREKSDPCGFIHGYCFDPYAGDWWDNPGSDAQRYGPCNDRVPPVAARPPGEVPHELITDNNRIAWTTPIGVEEPEDHV